MDIEIRPAVTDEDYEAWREVRIAVLPYERAASLEEMRKRDSPSRLALLAYQDGKVVGSGLSDKSGFIGAGFVAPRVIPSARRQGIGTAILRVLSDHVRSLGFETLSGDTDDEGSKAFAERFGMQEAERQVEQIRAIGDEPEPTFPEGVSVVSMHPSLMRPLFDTVVHPGYLDMAFSHAIQITYDEWEKTGIPNPEATFVAMHGDEPIGLAGLELDVDNPERAEHGLTAVRRDWRGKGVAASLKRATLHWAAQHGICEVYTWTQRGNEDMRRLNEHLGFSYRTICYVMQGPLL